VKRVCGWCQKTLGYKPGVGTTHGICRKCKAKLLAEIEGGSSVIDYKAMLVEVLYELDQYQKVRSKAETRLYDWFVKKENDPAWQEVLAQAERR